MCDFWHVRVPPVVYEDNFIYFVIRGARSLPR